MAQQYDSWFRTFTAGEAISQHQLVYLSGADTVSICGLANRGIGFATTNAASGASVTVKMLYPTFKAIAKEALAANATLYTEAGGKLQDTAESTSLPMFVALEAATAENDIIEVMPIHYGGVAAS